MKHTNAVLAAVVLCGLVAACASGTPTVAPSSPTPATATPTATAATPSPAGSSSTAPASTGTPLSSATPAHTPSTVPSPTPVASPDAAAIAAWAAGVCDINADYLDGNVQIGTDVPDPTDRTLDNLRQVYRDRSPLLHTLFGDILGRLETLAPIPGVEPLADSLKDEVSSQDASLVLFDADVEAATSVEDLDAALEATAGRIHGFVESARAVAALPLAVTDELATVTSGCRNLEYDALARVHGVETKDFASTAVEDDFASAGLWPDGPFNGGTTDYVDGTLRVTFTEAGNHGITTKGIDPSRYHDVRVEATYSIDEFALSGLSCRGNGERRYTVQVNPTGLVLIYRWGDTQTLLGRRAMPVGAVAAGAVNLAIECIDGNLSPLRINVYLDGERVAEVSDPDPLGPDGVIGMFAQGLGGTAVTAYDDFAVLVPAD